APVVLDGEIVALENGEPARFQALQGRYHRIRDVEKHRDATPSALIAFDVLLARGKPLAEEPWTERRSVLEEILKTNKDPALRISIVSKKPKPLLAEAKKHGWEGVMAKRSSSRYCPGERTKDWLKLKLERRQE